MRGATSIASGSRRKRAGQRADFLGVGRGEHEVLPLCRQELEHALDVGNEAHVEHAIGFVQHEDLDCAQIYSALLAEIQQATRRGHEDVAAPAHRIDLRVDAHAAEHGDRAQLQVPAVIPGALRHLGGELAGRRQHQGPRCAPLPVVQLLQDRQDETGGLTGARLGSGKHVAAGHYGGYGLGLNGGGRVVAFIGDSTQQFGQEPEIRK